MLGKQSINFKVKRKEKQNKLSMKLKQFTVKITQPKARFLKRLNILIHFQTHLKKEKTAFTKIKERPSI